MKFRKDIGICLKLQAVFSFMYHLFLLFIKLIKMKKGFYFSILLSTFFSSLIFAQNADLFFLNQNGTNRFILKDPGGIDQWTGTSAAIDPATINGFDIVVSEDFNGDGCKDLFLLNQDGVNRFILKDAGGVDQWTGTSYAFPEMEVNGFDFVIAEDFNGDGIADLFFLNREGANRFIQKDAGGIDQWTGTSYAFSEMEVNGFDFVIAEDFNGDGIADLFFLNQEGANRFIQKDAGGIDQWTGTSYAFSEMEVNGFDFVIAEDWSQCSPVTNTQNVEYENMSFEVYPNPAMNNINVRINSEVNSRMIFSIVDVTGKRVLVSSPREISQGLQTLELPIEELSNGIYILEYRSEEKVGFQKIVIEK